MYFKRRLIARACLYAPRARACALAGVTLLLTLCVQAGNHCSDSRLCGWWHAAPQHPAQHVRTSTPLHPSPTAVVLMLVAKAPPPLLTLLRLRRHNQWIKFVMDESENERMHLRTFMELWQPSAAQRALVVSAQAVFCAGYWAAYVLFPRTSHRFVGTHTPRPTVLPSPPCVVLVFTPSPHRIS